MSCVAIAIGGSALVGAGVSLYESNNAANTQANAANQASELQAQEFNQIQQNQAPYLQAGYGALSGMQQITNQGAPTFTAQDFYNNEDPAYQFDLSQGTQAIQRSAAASGSLMSGGTLKSLSNYAQGQASNEYENAYNRFMNSQNTQYNRLASLAGLGQTANGQTTQAGLTTAGEMGQNITGAANAQAAADISQGNTISGLASSGTSAWLGYNQMQNQNNLISALYGNTPSGQATSAWTADQNNMIGTASDSYQMPEFGSSADGSGYSLLGSGSAGYQMPSFTGPAAPASPYSLLAGD